MWMVGCGDGSHEFNMPDSLNGRKLRPLIPKPSSAFSPKNTTHSAAVTLTTTPTYCSCIRSTDHFAVNHHLATATDEQSKTDISTEPLVNSRWNPTPEQLNALEEMYRGGTRTPTAEQIQQIAAKLRRFGRIEGKNVFYWFQNHKARERQKRRRRILDSASEEQLCHLESLEGKESELSRTSFEVGQKKNWTTPSNCSTISEECVSIHRAESRTNEWNQFEERELQQRSSLIRAKHATWRMSGLSCSTHPTYLSNTTIATTTTIAPEALGTTDQKLSTNSQNLNREINFSNIEDESRESQTLQLFPLRSDDWNHIDDAEVPITTIDISFTPNQFFEFL